MDRIIFQIQVRSMKQALEHLRCLDLAGMETLAVTYGSPAEQATIAATRAFLQTLP